MFSRSLVSSSSPWLKGDEGIDTIKEPDADIRRRIGNHHLIFDYSLSIARRSFMSKNR